VGGRLKKELLAEKKFWAYLLVPKEKKKSSESASAKKYARALGEGGKKGSTARSTGPYIRES